MENLAQFIGRFHPLFVHLPIGILLVGILFDWMSGWKRFYKLRDAVPMLYLFGGFSALFSCLTGYLLSTSGEYAGATLNQHKWLGIAVAVVAFISHFLQPYNRFKGSWAVKFVPLILFALISLTGHLGGSLTHGEDYLFVYMPEPFKTWVIGKEAERVVIPNVQEAQVYADIVVPILKESCYKCHSERKQKGKLRLDSPEFIAKGGESGKTIVTANQPEESEMIRRLLLPKSDEEHMPTSKKDELTKEAVALLTWWIEQGASYEKQVKELQQPEAMKPVLLALESPAVAVSKSDFPEVTIPAAKEEHIAALRSIRAIVLPIGQDNNLLSINFVNVKEIGANEMQLLKAIKENIAWLRMSDSNLTDDAMTYLAQMPNLTKLYLDHTDIDDEGLKKLTVLPHLKYLNLVGTKVSLEGLSNLKVLPSLEKLFIYQTETSAEDQARLKEMLEEVEIDAGGYLVPTFASDTTFFEY